MTVECRVTGRDGDLTATVSGRLRLVDTTDLRNGLLKCLADQPEALFVDLAGLTVVEPLAFAVFAVISRQAARWPGIPVVFCAPSRTAREALRDGAFRRLPVMDSVETARQCVRTDGQSVPSLIEDLLPIGGAARQARNMATEACLRWDLPDLVPSASLIAGELVTNVVQHVNTIATLRISLRQRFVMIGVKDGSAEEPRLVTPSLSGGRGLLLVEAISYRWGWLPTDGGKVVWASLARD